MIMYVQELLGFLNPLQLGIHQHTSGTVADKFVKMQNALEVNFYCRRDAISKRGYCFSGAKHFILLQWKILAF